MEPFVNYSEEVVNPLFIWYMKPEYAKNELVVLTQDLSSRTGEVQSHLSNVCTKIVYAE